MIKYLAFISVFAAGLCSGGAGMMCWLDGDAGASTAPTRVVERTVEVPVACAIRYDGLGLLGLKVYQDFRNVLANPEAWTAIPSPADKENEQLRQLILALEGGSAGVGDPEETRDIASLVAGLPYEKVYHYLKQTLRIDPDFLDGGSHLPSLSQRLYDIATRQDLGPAENVSMLFGTKIDDDEKIISPTPVFIGDPTRVYATFSTAKPGYNRLLVKWHRVGDETPLLFVTERMRPTDVNHYVYLQLADPWEPGTYLVEVFDPLNLSEAISNGVFVVETGTKTEN